MLTGSVSDPAENKVLSVPPRLLVVDDDPAYRNLISEFIQPDGYQVLTAMDGLDALSHLVEPLPDLIITDLRMPRMSGFELARIIRERFQNLPVIVMSGEFGEDELPSQVPADAYLPKGSCTAARLRAKIRELLSAVSNNR